ncbi:MAG: hypothetical protein H6811_00245 [Phycisphaeraceae bacterium]|nr:hypothetical protein [Phycisphaeraceae bacterium]
MSGAGAWTVIELDHDKLCAICARVSGSRVTVRSWALATRPKDVDPSDATAVGEWIGRTLSAESMPRSRVMISLSRRDVVLKRLAVPEGARGAEIPGVVRLQMSRQLSVGMEGTQIDYQPAEDGAVLAGALPGDRFSWLGQMAKRAGLRVRRMTLRGFGLLPLIASSAERPDAPVLAVSTGAGSTEFAVLGGGQVLFLRTADVTRPTDDAELESFGQRLAVEAKRTWMSFRVGPESTEVEAVVVVGEDEVASEVGSACASGLELPWTTIRHPAWLRLPEHMPPELAAMVLPLAGLLHPATEGFLNFQSPRRGPDTGAVRRQVALLGAFALLLVGGGGYVLGSNALRRLEGRVKELNETNGELRAEYSALLKERARLEHLRAWIGARPAWSGQIRWLSDRLPTPPAGLVNVIQASASIDSVEFTPEGTGVLDGSWRAPADTRLVVAGAAQRAEVVQELRRRLIEGEFYRVVTEGQDVPDRYRFELQAAGVAGPHEAPAGGDS